MASTAYTIQQQARIDGLMETASAALVERRYFDAEQTCLEALSKAHAILDYDRMARIVLPLQEARRQKRDMAAEAAHAGAVFVLATPIPSDGPPAPGCYLITPPRVGVDGRALREAADRRRIPIIVIVREPTTRDGLWPIVAVGPITVRTKVVPPPPPPPPLPSPPPPAVMGGRKKKTDVVPPPLPIPPAVAGDPVPAPQWFLAANEALGDAAIVAAMLRPTLAARVDALLEHLHAHPDHEKLHQRLEEVARLAAREPVITRRPPVPLDPDGDDESMD